MTCHFFYRDLKRKSFGLACHRMKGSHTYSEIAHAMESVLRHYGIQNKTTSAVTDSGSNESLPWLM